MIITYYQALLLLSLVLTLLYILSWHKHFDVHITVIFTLVPITILGNLAMASAQTKEEAILAVKVAYIGGSFLVLMIALAIFNLCHISVHRGLRLLMFTVCCAMYLSAMTIGETDWFYKSCDFSVTNGVGALVNKEYGVLHTIFDALVLVFFAISMAAMVYSYFRKKDVSKKIIVLLFIPEMLAVLSFFGGRQITKKIELLPLAYVISQVVYLIIVRQVCLYDITDSGIDSIVQTGDKGFLSFDFRKHYIGCNETAAGIFPELASVNVDTVIPPENPLAARVNEWLDAFAKDEKNNDFHYEHNDRIYLITVNYLFDGLRKQGYQLFITDDTESQRYIALLNDFNTQLQDQVTEKTKHIVEMHEKLILGMATMVESRDNSTGGHIRRTSEGVRILTDEIRKDNTLGLSEEVIRNLIKAAPMHDLGKIAVDDQVLRKPGRFEPWEYEIMKTHAKEGARIVHSILQGTDDELFHHIAENMAHYHHERWDGSGYPDGLKGEEIPIEARIMAIADVYDALVCKRVYKDSMSFEKADSIIMDGMGKQFDPNLKRFYVAARPRLEAYYQTQEETGEAEKKVDLCAHGA
ncbi:MAG: HD domain-containing protein [Lachnospiraceae bacterium]|nr:HD domain-containing protein [Lachnospiraceae bacterium]